MTRTQSIPLISSSGRNRAVNKDSYQTAAEYHASPLSNPSASPIPPTERYFLISANSLKNSNNTIVFDAETDKKQRTVEINKRMAAWGKR